MAHHGVTLIPTLSVGVDIMGIAIVFVSVVGLFGVVRGCKRLMNVVRDLRFSLSLLMCRF